MLIAMLAIACGDSAGGGGSSGMPAAGASAAGTTAAGTQGPAPSFAAIYTDILQPSCAVEGPCHSADTPTGLGLPDAAAAYAALVDVPPAGIALCGAFAGDRVTPGDPAASLLIEKIGNQTPSCGGSMPPGGALLPADQIETIRAWVAAGAPNN
jgi:hypothetical protein